MRSQDAAVSGPRSRGTVLIFAVAAVATGLLPGSWSLAHDFWIEPDTFRPAAGTVLSLRLFVGEGFRGDPVPRNDGLIERFVLVDGEKQVPIRGREGDDPAGAVPIRGGGIQIVAYRSSPSPVELEARRFEEYLTQEGLESVHEARVRRGESSRPGKEIFSRCAKALLETRGSGSPGGSVPAAHDRRVGLPLELVPRRNPYRLARGAPLPIQVFYLGKPLKGALVVAMNQDDPSIRLSGRSNRAGEVSFRLPRAGVWLIKAVHMVPAPRDSAASADWESLWASLTFEIPGGG